VVRLAVEELRAEGGREEIGGLAVLNSAIKLTVKG
jgi:hypothetical protein